MANGTEKASAPETLEQAYELRPLRLRPGAFSAADAEEAKALMRGHGFNEQQIGEAFERACGVSSEPAADLFWVGRSIYSPALKRRRQTYRVARRRTATPEPPRGSV